ncbi:AMP-binding enzyme family protein [Mycobacterium xenopi 3993]|nr:AMP-binding enzyme family protein [Mycobacterium xenopi 3993]
MHRIVGRESVDLIKSGGYRVGAGEVEAALLSHPDVAEAAVVGFPTTIWASGLLRSWSGKPNRRH